MIDKDLAMSKEIFGEGALKPVVVVGHPPPVKKKKQCLDLRP